uniref:Ciliary microtubule inner protein 2A-C-like domain-containing protein n=1 Tax=Chelydra serpentina TaxID=8475 RepID=A0A8C3XN26_CHESE
MTGTGCHKGTYGGFYPQVRYQVGETYGKTTSRLLTDPRVPKSPCSVLAPLAKPRFIEDFSGTKHPSKQMLDQNYSYFPGYTGDSWGSPWGSLRSTRPPPAAAGFWVWKGAPGCGRGLACGRGEGSGRRLPRGGGARSLEAATCLLSPRQRRVPLDAVTETVDVSRYNQLPKLDVPNLIQRKAISGYTGFVPRFTWIMGVNYLQGVKDAMNEFDRNQFMLRNPVWNFGKRLPQTYWPNNKIYTSAGLIPFYTGFVPTGCNKQMEEAQRNSESVLFSRTGHCYNTPAA